MKNLRLDLRVFSANGKLQDIIDGLEELTEELKEGLSNGRVHQNCWNPVNHLDCELDYDFVIAEDVHEKTETCAKGETSDGVKI